MDPMTAISLVSSLVQVIDFTSGLLSRAVTLYRSADGALISNRDLEKVTYDLRNVSQTLAVNAREGPVGVHDLALRGLCEDCERIAQELLERLEKLKVKTSSRMRRWRSIRQALETVWSKDAIDERLDRLARYREAIDSRAILSILDQVKDINKAQGESLSKNDANAYQILQAMNENRSLFKSDIDQQSDLLKRLEKSHSSTNEMVRLLVDRSNTPIPQDNGVDQPIMKYDLHEVVRSGDKKETRRLLRQDPSNVNSLNEIGRTPLHGAKDEASVVMLIAAGANVDVQDDFGQTPLHVAAKVGLPYVVKELISSGASKSIKDDNASTPEEIAANTPLMSWLLKYGSDPNFRCETLSGNTALLHLASLGDIEGVRFFLDLGSDPNVRNIKKQTALKEAAVHGDLDMIRLLVARGAHVRQTALDDSVFTVLQQAIINNHPEAVKLLVELGADVCVDGVSSQRTCLGFACSSNKWTSAKALLELSEDNPLLFRRHDFYYALIDAAKAGELEILNLILGRIPRREGVWVQENYLFHKALHMASLAGQAEVVGVLLSNGAQKDHLDDHGITAMACAAMTGSFEVVSLLLASGADPNLAGYREEDASFTPLIYACNKRHVAMVEALLEAGASIEISFRSPLEHYWQPIAAACAGGSLEIVKLLHTSGSPLNSLNNINRGNCNPDKVGRGLVTPLFVAIDEQYLDIARYLLENGADPNFVTDTGWTPLRWAVCDGRRGDTRMMELLLEFDANINDARNATGITPLMQALLVKDKVAYRFLSQRGAELKGLGDDGNWSVWACLLRENLGEDVTYGTPFY